MTDVLVPLRTIKGQTAAPNAPGAVAVPTTGHSQRTANEYPEQTALARLNRNALAMASQALGHDQGAVARRRRFGRAAISIPSASHNAHSTKNTRPSPPTSAQNCRTDTGPAIISRTLVRRKISQGS